MWGRNYLVYVRVEAVGRYSPQLYAIIDLDLEVKVTLINNVTLVLSRAKATCVGARSERVT